MKNRRMRTRMYGGVGGRKTKEGGNLLLFSSYPIYLCLVPHVQASRGGALFCDLFKND